VLVVPSDTVGLLCSGDRFATKPAVPSLSFRLPVDRREGGAALRDFPCDPLRAYVPGGPLGLLEHLLSAVEVRGSPATS
jgi:hypothetical protein